MKILFRTLALSAVLLLCASCKGTGSFLDTDISEDAPRCGADPARVSAQAASFDASLSVEGEFLIESNCTWTVSVAPEYASLVQFYKDSDLNLSMVSKQYRAGFTVSDNLLPVDREIPLTLSSAAGETVLTIVQDAFSAVVESDPSDAVSLPCEGGDVVVKVRSNTSWTVSVDDGGTAVISIVGAAEGTKSGEFTFNVFSNLDAESGKTGSVRISADGAEDVVIEVKQAKYTS